MAKLNSLGKKPQGSRHRKYRRMPRVDQPEARNAKRRIAFGVSGLSALGTTACARMSR
jgi:hypothetical protein